MLFYSTIGRPPRTRVLEYSKLIDTRQQLKRADSTRRGKLKLVGPRLIEFVYARARCVPATMRSSTLPFVMLAAVLSLLGVANVRATVNVNDKQVNQLPVELVHT